MTPCRGCLGLALLLLSGCQQRSEAPQLRLAQPVHELGRAIEGSELTGSVAVVNAGSAPLVIESVRPGHSCTGQLEASTVARGASSQLRVSCRPPKSGRFRDSLVLLSNDPDSRESRLDLVGELVPPLAFDVQLLALEMPWGEVRTQEAHLTGPGANAAHLTLQSGAEPAFTLEPLANGGVRATFKGERPGFHTGTLVFSTGLDAPPTVALPYSCKVKGTLEVTPTNPFFNLKAPGEKVVTLEVKSTQPGFVLRSAEVLNGPFAATIERSTSGARVRVAVLPEQLADETRAATGTLLLSSNDRSEPNREVPLFGFGKLSRAPAEPE